MALRDWTISKLAIIWAAWLFLLLVALMVGLVLSPDGQIHLQLSDGGLNVSRWVLALVGGIALVLPPAIVTYLWYLARLRKWSREPDTADERV